MPGNKVRFMRLFLSAFVFMILFLTLPARADSPVQLSRGESVYVSIYSNVYSGPRKSAFQLAAMLSIRNTDPTFPIIILKVDYYDNNGNLVERYSPKEFELGPLVSTHFYIREYDKRGGPGAKFIVKWRAADLVNSPVIEGIMLGMASGQGVSFICPGQVIEEHDR